jgi:hypothetical protein
LWQQQFKDESASGACADELSSEELSNLAMIAASAAAAPATSRDQQSDKALYQTGNLRMSAELLKVLSKAHVLRMNTSHTASSGAAGLVQVRRGLDT